MISKEMTEWCTRRPRQAVAAPAKSTTCKQTIKDVGPLTKKWMETCDDDFAERTFDFHQGAAGNAG